MSTKDVPFGTWLLNQLERRDWNRSDLARKVGVGPNTVSRWVDGHRVPSYENCLDIASALSITPELIISPVEVVTRAGYTPIETITNQTVPPEELRKAMLEVAERFAPMRPSATPDVIKLRVVNAISASHGMSHDRQVEEEIDVPRWMLEGLRQEDALVFVVTGDCLREGDSIQYGDRVIIDTSVKEPAEGEIVAVRVNGEETLKHYHRFVDRVELRPSSDGYDPIIVYEGRGELEIIGVYVGMLRLPRRGGRQR